MPADRRRSAVHAAYLQVSSCRSALGEINVTGWMPSQMLHEMFTEPERSESVLEDDLIDQRLRAIFTEPEDRALRARREYWKVAGSLLASKENLAKAAIAMMRILGLYEHRAKPKDRVSRALQEFWKVAGSLLASDKDLAKAALAMIKILEDPSF